MKMDTGVSKSAWILLKTGIRLNFFESISDAQVVVFPMISGLPSYVIQELSGHFIPLFSAYFYSISYKFSIINIWD